MLKVVRYVWAGPNTVLGCLGALLALYRGRVVIVNGVIEAHGPLLQGALRYLVPIPGGAAAITLGHVVLGVDEEVLERSRPHERLHVAQYERWGPFFVPAYLLASLWMLAMGRDAYFDNYFEREAYGYQPVRSRRQRSFAPAAAVRRGALQDGVLERRVEGGEPTETRPAEPL